jgi:CheY-like chemotaxis protein
VDTLQVTEPARVLDSIVQFRPDLILMDMYMPDCNGMELAQIIRQQRCWTAFPSCSCRWKSGSPSSWIR